MKHLAYFVLFSFLFVESANAISRYNSMSLTCAQVKAIVSSEGAVIIRYPSKHTRGLTLYNRFVKNARWCQPDEYAARKSIPTADQNSCRLRYCKVREIERDIWHNGGFN